MHSRSVLCMTGHYNFYYVCIFSPVICEWLWKGWFLVLRVEDGQTLTEDGRSGHHWQAVMHLLKLATAFWSCGSCSQMVCKATFNLSVLSWASAGVYGTFPAWNPRQDSPVGSNLESLGTIDSCQWTQVSLLAASPAPAWEVLGELERRLAGRWSLPVVATSSICSKGLSISKSASSSQHQKTALFRATHILPEKTTFERRKTGNEFFKGCAAALCRWGRQINNFCVAYYPIVQNNVEIGQHM